MLKQGTYSFSDWHGHLAPGEATLNFSKFINDESLKKNSTRAGIHKQAAMRYQYENIYHV